MARWSRARQPDGDEALAALTLVADLRDWLAEIEPRLIDAARVGSWGVGNNGARKHVRPFSLLNIAARAGIVCTVTAGGA
jgi:hypothetical protein